MNNTLPQVDNEDKGVQAILLQRFGMLLNTILSIFGVRIARAPGHGFTMMEGLKRIAQREPNIAAVIDIGASDGKWAQDAIKIFPDARFLCIEPLIERRESLQRLKQMYFPKFDYEICVAGEDGSDLASLNVSPDLDGSTVDGSGGESRSVPCRSIDELVLLHQMSGPFLLKFDTHGFEKEILDGAKSTLEKVNVIIMECYNFQITQSSLRFPEMCLYLEAIGFRCADLMDPLCRPGGRAFWQMDLVFIRSQSTTFDSESYV